jgi:hypothetical protein
MAAFGISAIHPSASRAHIFGHASAPTGRIFEIWKGASNTANPFWVHSGGDVISAPITSPAIATNATNGFFFIRSGNGPATGTPANYVTGRVPLYYDYANHRIYIYHGAWRSVTLS